MSKITEIVRNLRKNQTETEKIIWEKIRNHRFMGLHFKRQEPIIFKYDNKSHFFVADFLCPKLNLVIEIDGKIHEYQKLHDKIRDDILHTLGYKVLRLKNDDVMDNVNVVLKKIKKFIDFNCPSQIPPQRRGNTSESI